LGVQWLLPQHVLAIRVNRRWLKRTNTVLMHLPVCSTEVYLGRMSRRTKIGLVVTSVIVLATFALAMYEAYVPGSTKVVFGSVLGLRQIANNSQPLIHRYVAVKLDDGHTIQARVDGHVTLVPGNRAAFVEITTPLMGFKRYRFQRHLDAQLR
jgi:hypothetical protein